MAGIIAAAGNASAHPSAQTTAPDVTAAGATSYSFTVRWTSDAGMDASSIDGGDMRVSGPGGFDVPAALASISGSDTVTAVYAIVPPGGTWDSGDNGTYAIVIQPNQVIDNLGNVAQAGTTASFRVAVTGPPAPAPAQPLNISTRMRVELNENVMIGGFIISGSQSKKVIIRALGPSLERFGIADFLADPVIELRAADGTLLRTNDNWKDTQQAEIEAANFGLSKDLEAAMIVTLAPANYTAIVSGKSSGQGVGLIEVYDMEPAVPSRLANISTRGRVQAGSNVMIGGFILGNSTQPGRLIIRGIGPSLTDFGISGALANPTLELRDANGTLVRANDDWKDTQQTEIQASGFAPSKELESAMVVTLAPAAYTAILASKNDLPGVGLVEVYQLP